MEPRKARISIDSEEHGYYRKKFPSIVDGLRGEYSFEIRIIPNRRGAFETSVQIQREKDISRYELKVKRGVLIPCPMKVCPEIADEVEKFNSAIANGLGLKMWRARI